MRSEPQAFQAGDGTHIYGAMSTAMLNGDREAFIRWGEGETRDQLARIWDETKKIGWTVGIVNAVYTDEELVGLLSSDPQRPMCARP